MDLIARPIDSWPGKFTSPRKPSQFTADWADTQDLLAYEVERIAGPKAEVVLQLAVTDREIRNDGWINARAIPSHPGVIITFTDRQGRPLRFHTDVFTEGPTSRHLNGWKSNVRAVAAGLESLRKLDRYGIANDNQQYQGWAQIGAGSVALGPSTMTRDEALRILADVSDYSTFQLDGDADARKDAFKQGAKQYHPDVNPTDPKADEQMKLISAAAALLDPKG